MDPTALATSLLSMSAQKTQTLVHFAVLKKQFEMQKSAIDMLLPIQAPAPSGMGKLIDKTA